MNKPTTKLAQLDYYGKEMQARRDKFNRIINGINMVLMNNIPEVDPSVYENWQGDDPMGNDDCELEPKGKPDKNGEQAYHCVTHDAYTTDEFECDEHEEDNEVYQWFAIGDNDADYLKSHNQYVTYSDMLDTYFLAICHLGTSWDYVDSMVNDILGDNND